MYRNVFNQSPHVFGLDWSPNGIFTWHKTRAVQNFMLEFKRSFWSRGNLKAATLANGTVFDDPWSKHGNAAPFDQDFYLILNVAVGGTNGYFPDAAGKPWNNGAEASRVPVTLSAQWGGEC